VVGKNRNSWPISGYRIDDCWTCKQHCDSRQCNLPHRPPCMGEFCLSQPVAWMTITKRTEQNLIVCSIICGSSATLLAVHLARITRDYISHSSEDHHKAIRQVPPDWQRPIRRPSHTWLCAVEADLGPLNFGLATVWRKATSRDKWRHTVEQQCSSGVCYERRKEVVNLNPK